MAHVSDSAAQRSAEETMLADLARARGFDFAVRPAAAKRLVGLKPDAVDWTKRVLVEAYARVGRLKGAQPHKVKGDILKLLLLERRLTGKWTKIICFGDAEAAKLLMGKSWTAAAAREFGVKVVVAKHSVRTAKSVVAAQKRQRMVNPA
jgi:hypothetical protein